jgi:hypothetical protein
MDIEKAPPEVMAILPQPPSKLALQYNCLHIVEWLFDSEKKTGKELQSFIHQHRPQVDVHFHEAHSAQDVLTALTKIAEEVERGNAFPIVHIEAHGDVHGEGFHGPAFTGAVEPEWDTLFYTAIGSHLVRINRACKANLILFSAACWGVSALLAAAKGPIPFMVVIGPTISVYPTPLLDATKEFYRHAFPTAGTTKPLDMVVDAASLELGNQGDLQKSSMVQLTYEALVGALWTKCAPDVIRTTALDMADTFHAPGEPIDLSQLHYSNALVRLHQDQGKAARVAWRDRLLMDTCPENLTRFDFDIEGMVRIILDERHAPANKDAIATPAHV